MTISPEVLLESLIRGENIGALVQRTRISYTAAEQLARDAGWTYDHGGRPIRLADDTPAGAELSQLDDRPSAASGEPGAWSDPAVVAAVRSTMHDCDDRHDGECSQCCRLTGRPCPHGRRLTGRPLLLDDRAAATPSGPGAPAGGPAVEAGQRRRGVLDTDAGPRPVEVTPLVDQVPPASWDLVADAERTVRVIDPATLSWLAVLNLSASDLVAVIELARTSERRALNVLAQAMIDDLGDLVELIRP